MAEKYYGCKSRDKLPVLQPESWDNPRKCPPGLNRAFSHILKTQKWQKQAKSGKNAYF